MSNSSVLVMPTFNLLPGATLAALLFLVEALVEVVDEEGEYVLSQIAEKKEATNLLSEDIVTIPLARRSPIVDGNIETNIETGP